LNDDELMTPYVYQTCNVTDDHFSV